MINIHCTSCSYSEELPFNCEYKYKDSKYFRNPIIIDHLRKFKKVNCGTDCNKCEDNMNFNNYQHCVYCYDVYALTYTYNEEKK